jgi:hypothetical protein
MTTDSRTKPNPLLPYQQPSFPHAPRQFPTQMSGGGAAHPFGGAAGGFYATAAGQMHGQTHQMPPAYQQQEMLHVQLPQRGDLPQRAYSTMLYQQRRQRGNFTRFPTTMSNEPIATTPQQQQVPMSMTMSVQMPMMAPISMTAPSMSQQPFSVPNTMIRPQVQHPTMPMTMGATGPPQQANMPPMAQPPPQLQKSTDSSHNEASAAATS